MNLFVRNGVDGAGNNLRYRGIDRRWPTYCEALPADHEINQLFSWYVNDGSDHPGGPVHDLRKAIRYAELCDIHFPAQHFEVVEFTRGAEVSESGGQFAGFDLSNGGLSLLCWGFLTESDHVGEIPEPIVTLSLLLARFFEPQLNENGLFQTIDSASFCLRAMSALQNLHHGLYESERETDLHEYEVTGIYLLPKIGNKP